MARVQFSPEVKKHDGVCSRTKRIHQTLQLLWNGPEYHEVLAITLYDAKIARELLQDMNELEDRLKACKKKIRVFPKGGPSVCYVYLRKCELDNVQYLTFLVQSVCDNWVTVEKLPWKNNSLVDHSSTQTLKRHLLLKLEKRY